MAFNFITKENDVKNGKKMYISSINRLKVSPAFVSETLCHEICSLLPIRLTKPNSQSTSMPKRVSEVNLVGH